MRPTSASYLLVASLSLVELAGCGGDDSALFGTSEHKDAGSTGRGGSTGGGAGTTTGGSSGAAAASGSAGSGEAGTAGSAGADDAGTGGTAGAEQDGSVDAAGASGSGGAGADASCAQPITYFADSDADGFGDAKSSMKACHPPDKGYSTNDDDCYDGNAEAKPGQTGWFTTHRGDGSYDYDCNGTGVRRWTGTGSCPLALCTVIQGWQGMTMPNCGDNGAWVTGCTSLPFCQVQTERRDQQCH